MTTVEPDGTVTTEEMTSEVVGGGRLGCWEERSKLEDSISNSSLRKPPEEIWGVTERTVPAEMVPPREVWVGVPTVWVVWEKGSFSVELREASSLSFTRILGCDMMRPSPLVSSAVMTKGT